MKRFLALSLAALFATGLALHSINTANAEEVVRIAIVDGKGYHHGAQPNPAMKEALEVDDRLRVDFVEIAKLPEADLSPYAALVIADAYPADQLGRAEFERVKQYVHDGGGLVLIHFACGAFHELAEEFEPIAGRVWFGKPAPEGRHQHDPYGEFSVKINDVDHPITQGLSDFDTIDELYTCFEDSEVPITVLAESTSKNDGKDYPMAFVLKYNDGRVFHCTLGHDRRAITSDGPAELIRRGTAWTVGLEATK
jgi:type 1 glutamine amidotransferase